MPAATKGHSSTGSKVEFGPAVIDADFAEWADDSDDAITYAPVGGDKTAQAPFEALQNVDLSGLADQKDRNISGTASTASTTNTCTYTKARLAALLAIKGVPKSWRFLGPDLTGDKCQGYLASAKQVTGARNTEKLIEYVVMPDNGVYPTDANA